MTTMKKQHVIHPHATAVIREHREAVKALRQFRKENPILNDNKEHVRFLERVISFSGQVYNARISEKSFNTIKGLS
jgi:hypothetical protein